MLPEIKLIKKDEKLKHLELSLFIPDTLKYFDGHFPKYPVLPGVVQIDWVIFFVKNYLNNFNIHITNIDQLKFTQVILPNSKVDVKIQLNENKIDFQYFKDKTSFSTGKIIYK